MEKSATLSNDRKYRYTLWRSWEYEKGYIIFIGLNPSTADETEDDPTIRRCIGFTKAWGYGSLCMINLFAFRATNPVDMLTESDPVGPENDTYLFDVCKQSRLIIAAWGTNGGYLRRDKEVIQLIPNLYYLRLTKQGFPSHPLYLPKDLKPIKWNW
jgi:hypothetical protein